MNCEAKGKVGKEGWKKKKERKQQQRGVMKRKGGRIKCSIHCSNENMQGMWVRGMEIKGEGVCMSVWDTGLMRAVGQVS